MTKIPEKKTRVAAVLALCLLTVAAGVLSGRALPAFGGNAIITPAVELRADGPIYPPDPWDRNKSLESRADGPIYPPDPWDRNKLADGPIYPPDPWDRNKAV